MMPEKSNILFAEDSSNDRLLILMGLEKAGLALEVNCVGDGFAATEYLAGKNQYADRERFPRPSLLLTDIKMPRMDGLELLAWVRARKEFKTLPVIVVTGSDQDADRERALELGANSYVTKELLIQPPVGLIDSILNFVEPAPQPLLH